MTLSANGSKIWKVPYLKIAGKKNQCWTGSATLLMQPLVNFCTSVCHLPWHSSKDICSTPQMNFFVTPLWLLFSAYSLYLFPKKRIQPWSLLLDTEHRQPLVLSTFLCMTPLCYFFISQSNGGSVSLTGPVQNTAEHCDFTPSQLINLSPWLAMNLLGLSGHTVWHCCTWRYRSCTLRKSGCTWVAWKSFFYFYAIYGAIRENERATGALDKSGIILWNMHLIAILLKQSKTGWIQSPNKDKLTSLVCR